MINKRKNSPQFATHHSSLSKENQNIEWKQSWRDEYVKWICGFANADGGNLFIGKNDKGAVTGISDARKLLTDIPNKVRDILGIIVDVNLKTEKRKDYLEITVESYPYPVSYKGRYHYRTGSTKQELKGAALDKFLLQKQGKRWDGVPLPDVSVKDLHAQAFDYFREKAAKSKRLGLDVLKEKNGILIKKLHLTEKQYLKRAAVLLFHPDPEKFINGSYVKIGYFKTDDDLLFQDEIHGDLFEQVEKTMDLLLTKYLKANIKYEKLTRIEEYPFPEAALREALLNAIAHKDYSSGNPIQISVYSDKILFWNDGQLPENWTVEQLMRKHPSKPFNPDIANVFFRAGLIEAWGRGIHKIVRECNELKSPKPVFRYDLSGFFVEMFSKEIKKPRKNARKSSPKSSPKGSPKGSPKAGELILKMIRRNQTISTEEMGTRIGKSKRTVLKQIDKLKKQGFIKRFGPSRGGHWEIVRNDKL